MARRELKRLEQAKAADRHTMRAGGLRAARFDSARGRLYTGDNK
jgi:hypothetical protein